MDMLALRLIKGVERRLRVSDWAQHVRGLAAERGENALDSAQADEVMDLDLVSALTFISPSHLPTYLS